MKVTKKPCMNSASFGAGKSVNPVGIIDSFNVSSQTLIAILSEHPDFNLQTVKSGQNANERLWFQEFGAPLYKQTKTGRWAPLEAYIAYNVRGVSLPLKVFKHPYGISEVLEFAGLQRYDEIGKERKLVLQSLWSKIPNCNISRIDIAIDLVNPQHIKQMEMGLKHRGRIAVQHKNSTYYRTKKQKKKRGVVTILKYPKGEKEGWEDKSQIIRYEFQFRSEFFKGLKVKDYRTALKKMENRIKRDTGLSIKILSPFHNKLDPQTQSCAISSPSVWKQMVSTLGEIKNSITNAVKEIKRLYGKLDELHSFLMELSQSIHAICDGRTRKRFVPVSYMKTKEMAENISV
ncbi:hypothetical protein [Sulfurovum sp.]|uniref:hypothetical protein n=1 Tax=Sulfurovum sp. TaxID=1969726 RepID=UPI0025F3D0E9|nr:hypothetical protein [Sulfurovum sp.]